LVAAGHLSFGAGSGGGSGSSSASSAAAAAAAASSLFGGAFNPYAAVLPYPLAYPGLGLLAAAGEFGAVPSLASANPSEWRPLPCRPPHADAAAAVLLVASAAWLPATAGPSAYLN